MEYFIYVLKSLKYTSNHAIYIAPIVCIFIDIITGLIKSIFVNKNFKTSIMRKGLGKKYSEVAALFTCGLLSYLMGVDNMLLNASSMFIVLMEVLSMLENWCDMGLPLPKAFIKYIRDIHHSIDNVTTEDLEKELINYGKHKRR
jgi:toxin secretion/phage lysis holin